MDLKVLTKTLEIQPCGTWRVGERRKTPQGALLDGFYGESYWYTRLAPPDDSDFPAFLMRTLEALSKHRGLLQQIRETGGRAEFHVGLDPGGALLGEVIPHYVLGALAEFGMDLGLDVMYDGQSVESVESA
ncbi:MAG: hypothetical protein KGS61_10680 [Verrucomicrobia bacterium]|nr:hypothetical protein [Verrucomicrobiota bacterium]